MSTDLPVDKVETAMKAYFVANRPAGLPPEFSFYEAQRSDPRETPCAVFTASLAKARDGAAGINGVCDVTLAIDVLSHSEDSDAADHRTNAGLLLGVINDKDALRAALNAPAVPAEDERVQKDSHIFDYFLMESGKRSDGKKWWSNITLRVVAVGKDVPPG